MRIVLTFTALIAFAANSLLCRMALGEERIDPVSFTTVRLASGAFALLLICWWRGNSRKLSLRENGSWFSALALFCYAGAFSFAYVYLDTGTGALILFGAVQLTILGVALKTGERLRLGQWTGFAVAVAGLVYLLIPGATAPDPVGALLMCLSGVAWGLYSIQGKEVSSPVTMTMGNFLRATPMTICLSVIAVYSFSIEPPGLILAVVSGVVTSGLGYVVWYTALPKLSLSQAAIVQLMVPVIAAFGGVVFLSEIVSYRLIVASMLILSGVALSVLRRS